MDHVTVYYPTRRCSQGHLEEWTKGRPESAQPAPPPGETPPINAMRSRQGRDPSTGTLWFKQAVLDANNTCCVSSWLQRGHGHPTAKLKARDGRVLPRTAQPDPVDRDLVLGRTAWIDADLGRQVAVAHDKYVALHSVVVWTSC
jgi:hypothetical protein